MAYSRSHPVWRLQHIQVRDASSSTSTSISRQGANMKTQMIRFAIFAALLTGVGCEVKQIDDPNNPTVSSVLNDASKGQLQNLVAGLEARHRATIGGVPPVFGSFSRELWLIQTDPRSLTDLLGINVAPYPDHFGTGVTFQTPYQAIKQANVLIESVDNTTVLTPAEASAYKGFAK